MTVEEFSLFSVDDPHDLEFDCGICWSRLYEYPFVISRMSGSVHNTSWGFNGIHVVFKEWLDANVTDVLHSDIKDSELVNTTSWDVRTPPRVEWLERFDTVVSVSTLEEVRRASHVDIIRDSFLPQVKSGGRLIVTFDLPGFQLEDVERFLGVDMKVPVEPLTPRNSPTPWRDLSEDYRVGYLVIRK